MCAPLPITSRMDPTPTAEIEEPLTPLTVQFTMGLSCRKSLCSGERCVVQPLSRRKGDKARETSLSRFVDVMGETEIAKR